MGVAVGDGFDFYREGTNYLSFRLKVQRIDPVKGVVDFLVDRSGSGISLYSVTATRDCSVEFSDGPPCNVALGRIFTTRHSVPVANLIFYTRRSYDWQRYERMPSCRR